MIPRQALGFVLLAALAAGPASAGQISVDYDVDPSFMAFGAQSVGVSGGSFTVTMSGGATTTGGTVQPGPATLTQLSLQLTRTLTLTGTAGTGRFRTLSFYGQSVPGTLTPTTRTNILGTAVIIPIKLLNPDSIVVTLTINDWRQTGLNAVGPDQLRIYGKINPLLTMFLTGREVARGPAVPEPAAGWLALTGVAAAAAIGRIRARRR